MLMTGCPTVPLRFELNNVDNTIPPPSVIDNASTIFNPKAILSESKLIDPRLVFWNTINFNDSPSYFLVVLRIVDVELSPNWN